MASHSSDCISLTDNDFVTPLVAAVPFISIGILAFGVATFFVVIRRITPSSFCLYLSILFSFGASMLSLAQVLMAIQWTPSQDQDLNSSTTLDKVADVLLAVSLGLRFLFYWLFVAECPRGERQSAHVSKIGWMNFFVHHSASWQRWGTIGLILKFALLAAAIAITVLQFLWRLVPHFHKYGPVYAAEKSVELVASALLILKLILNASISPITPYSHALRAYLAVIVALLINIGVTVGDLRTFDFSDQSIGRMIQGIELYVLIVFILIYTAGSRLPRGIPEYDSRQTARQFEKPTSISPISPQEVIPPPMSIIFDSAPAARTKTSSNEAVRQVSLASAVASRVSSFMGGPRGLTMQQAAEDGDQERLWNQAEAGHLIERKLSTDSSDSMNTLTPPTKAMSNWEDGSRVSFLPGSSMSSAPNTARPEGTSNAFNINPQTSAEPPGSPFTDSFTRPQRPRLRMSTINAKRTTSFSLNSYYGKDISSQGNPMVIMTAPPTAQAQEAPSFNLDDLRTAFASRGINVKGGDSSVRDTDASLEELLRRQEDLDQTIERLRFFSPRASMASLSCYSNSVISADGNVQEARFSNTNSTGARTVASEFSFSAFPSPPLPSPLPPPLPAMSSRLPTLRPPGFVLESADDDTVVIAPLAPPRMPAVYPDLSPSYGTQVMPETPRADDDSVMMVNGRSTRFDSGVTRYDVTSFIDELTSPNGCSSGSLQINCAPMSRSDIIMNEASNSPRVAPLGLVDKGNQGRWSPNLLVPGGEKKIGLPSSPARKQKSSLISQKSKLSFVEMAIAESITTPTAKAVSMHTISRPQSPFVRPRSAASSAKSAPPSVNVTDLLPRPRARTISSPRKSLRNVELELNNIAPLVPRHLGPRGG